MLYTVSARHLAEFALEHGDLYMEIDAAQRMREGMEGHLRLQRQLDDTYTTEESVVTEIKKDGVSLKITGRADAVRRYNKTLTIEEIKTTQLTPDSVSEKDHPEHRAQAEIYAYIIAKKEGCKEAEVAVIYYNLNGGMSRRPETVSIFELERRFYSYTDPYIRWILALETRREKFIPSVRELRFPFETYRDGQRQMAKSIFLAAREKRRALIEAPTGIGKSAASLFGALKALGEGYGTALFYLTARTTGKASAENALRIMREKGLCVRSVTITAKEKACLLENRNCLGCPYAADYFSRHRAVLVQALETDVLDAESIKNIALENELCPFELSLDLAESADVVICDYNYVFDPRVRLKRFFTNAFDGLVLVDEAHNLPDRARDMLTASLNGRAVARIYRKLDKDDPFRMPIEKLLEALACKKDAETEVKELPEDKIAIAAENLSDFISERLSNWHPLFGELSILMFDTLWYAKRHGEFDPEMSRFTLVPDGRFYNATLLCVDARKHIDASLKRVRSSSVFSATLTPNDFYAECMAINAREGDDVISLPSPFPKENQLTLLCETDVRYASREETLNDVCACIHEMKLAKKGAYIACFPSYAYMELAFDRYLMLYPDDHAIKQGRSIPEEERAAFIDSFAGRDSIAFIVLGGVFAEGVDLPGDKLLGAAVVTVGYPQICLEREIMSEMLDYGNGEGRDYAYIYPGFRRVMQAAGRVIRTENDKGVVLLIDARFRDEKYRELMPENWRVRRVNDRKKLKNVLARFWA